MRTIAILSDIHGNLTALEAVLEDALQLGATDYWILGDFLMPGPGSSELLELIYKLPNLITVRGNWDDCLLEARTQVLKNPRDIYIARLAQYQYDRLSLADVDFIRKMPLTAQVGEFAISHNLPQKNYGGELVGDPSPEVLGLLFEGPSAKVAVHGHTHFQRCIPAMDRYVINPGSVGHPYVGENRKQGMADYGVLSVDSHGKWHMDLRTVPYEVETEKERARMAGLPYLELYLELLDTGATYTHNFEVLERV